MTKKSKLKKRSLGIITTSMLLLLPIGQVLAIDIHAPDIQSDELMSDQLVVPDEPIDVEVPESISGNNEETSFEEVNEEVQGIDEEIQPEVVLPEQELSSIVDHSEIAEDELDVPEELERIALPPGVNAVYTGQVGTIPWVIDDTGTLTLGSGIFDEVNDVGGNYESTDYFNHTAYSDSITRIVLTGPVVLHGSQRGTKNFAPHAGGADSTRQGFFAYLSNLQTIEGMHYLDTSNVTDMNSMFLRSSGLLELDVSSFDTSNVTNMAQMFTELANLRKLDVSSFETHQVTDMSHMFRGLARVDQLDVSNFVTSQVTDMSGMFSSVSLSEIDLSNFDTSNVTEMWWMFASASNIKSLDLSNFDTSKVTRMHSMFADARSLESVDLSNFDTSNVRDMWRMFADARSLRKLDLSSFDTRQVSNMLAMFDRISLEQLTLGSSFVFNMVGGGPGLLPLTSSATHHPNWQNVGEGTGDEPKGSFVFTSAQLMANYDGATMADTWVWQPRTFSNLIIEAEGQGTVSPATSTSVERGEMIDISATAESGWRFSHWRIESGEGTIADTNQAITTFVMGEEDTKLVAVFEELNSLLSIRIPTSAVFNTTSESKHRDIVSPDYEIGNESPFAVFVNVVEPTELKNMDIIEELNVAADGGENVLISQGSAHQTEAFRLFELATEETNTFTFTGTAEELPEGSSHITPTFNLVLRFVPNLS
ncbi:BspA family leucine-rich repeat surface protein [Candidatus Enterococcus mangumiae]|uniref:Bacterial repeat domain-containing protein n=1 Tax=Candidatus Enterococcus mangumiae TaxID=2230878 RepID=A0ABZ2SWW2_9ENTE|nr:BspA family leucine-rich repeat surface protein [Enterococcus sp. DIV1094]